MPSAVAKLRGQIVANSQETVVVEGNHYFPPSSIKKDFFKSTGTKTHCPWKGDASYYSIEVNGGSPYGASRPAR